MPSFILTAPSRLHFGLWSFGGADLRQFGGVGVMIEQPALKLAVASAEEFLVTGAASERAGLFARRWASFHGRSLPNCRLSIEQAIPEHAGLGSGTQLGLGVAALLSAFVGLASPAPQDLAQSVGRGLRSAVGTYGFAFGGLIVEQGKSPQDAISPLEYRLDLPAEWRFVLMTPCGLAGLAGQEEAQAFECLPPVPSPVTTTLVSEVQERLAPAAAAADFDAFAESVYRYGRLAGECFAARQGGPYNGPLVTELVESVRRVGCAGVGQSSWGPTVFAVTSSRSAADQLVQRLQTAWREPLSIVVTGAANHGARLVEHAHDREPAVP